LSSTTWVAVSAGSVIAVGLKAMSLATTVTPAPASEAEAPVLAEADGAAVAPPDEQATVRAASPARATA
jgi:hypothetical protein